MYNLSMNETRKKTGWFKKVFVDELSSCKDFQENFNNVTGHKTSVEDFIGGKATFKITISGKWNDEDLFAPRTDCFITFRFPKDWTRKKMLEVGLNNIGFTTSTNENSFVWVSVTGLK